MSAVDVLRLVDRLETGIQLGESHFREFKSATDRASGSAAPREPKALCRDIAETLVAFANSDGGELYVGVEDDGTVSGVPHSDPVIQILLMAPITHVLARTALPSPTSSRLTYQGKLVLYFQAAKSTTQVHLTSDGRCLQRFDRENRPVSAEEIQYTRHEQRSREYDRAFVDGATLHHLNLDSIDAISKHIGGHQSPEKFLQYMDLAEYGPAGLALRRSALLLFAKDITRWNPRCEIRILGVQGKTLGVGKDYNVNPRDDHSVRGNVIHILETAWNALRPFLARTPLVGSGLFRESLLYPEDACREALVNAVAHRDYSIEGKGIEIFIYDDRLEIRSPGGLLSSIALKDLRSGKRTHQSRNVYVARVLRELGYMREMGEGMLRIFATMRDRDLVPPELDVTENQFDIVFHHRSVFSPKDQEWLQAYQDYNLTRDEQRVVLLGRDGHILATNEIVEALGIVDMDEFRALVEHLRRKGIFYRAVNRAKIGAALREVKSKRQVGQFAIRPPDQADQYRSELVDALRGEGSVDQLSTARLRAIVSQLSASSPYREALSDSLKLLGFVDQRLRPLPLLTKLWDVEQTGAPGGTHDSTRPSTVPDTSGTSHRVRGRIVALRVSDGYGFIAVDSAGEFFFHRSNLAIPDEWGRLAVGTYVSLERGERASLGRRPPAKNVEIERG